MLETYGRSLLSMFQSPMASETGIALSAAIMFGEAPTDTASVASSETAGGAVESSTLGQQYSVASAVVAGAAVVSSLIGQPVDIASSETAGGAVVSSVVLLEHEVTTSETAGAASLVGALFQQGQVVSSVVAGASVESTELYQPTGSRPNMTRLQLAAPIVGSDGLVSRLKDGRYRYTYAWSCSSGNWAALDLGTDAARTQILVCLSNESSGAGDIDDLGLANVTLRASADSTDGTNGTWTNYAITGNPYIYAARTIPFAGMRWLRLEVGAGVTAIDEFEVWNCSAGVDAFAFAGDSITNRGTKRHDAVQPSLQRLISNRISAYPCQIGAGIVGIGAATLNANIDGYLAAFPMVSYWLIGIGTNDAASGSSGLSAFTANLTSICNKIIAAGARPILARLPYTTLSSYGGGTYLSDNTYLYCQAIDSVRSSLGLRPGPDFYTYVYENQAVWYNAAEGGDGVHPGTTGVKMWNEQWANVVDDLYFDIVNNVTSTPIASAAIESQSVFQYPQVASNLAAAPATEESVLFQAHTIVSGTFAGVSIESVSIQQPSGVASAYTVEPQSESSLLTQLTLVVSSVLASAAVESSELLVLPTVTSSVTAGAAVESSSVVTAIRVQSDYSAAAAVESAQLQAVSHIFSDTVSGAASVSESIVFLINVESTITAQPALVQCSIMAGYEWAKPYRSQAFFPRRYVSSTRFTS